MKVKLGDIATYINGYAFKPSDWKTQGIPIIRIQDLTGNSYQTNYYDGESIDKKYEVNEGDVLISWSASLGVYIWKGEKALLNQHIFKVVFDKIDIDKMYYIYALKFSLMKMKSFMHGATMKHIVKKDFDNITIPFPSLEEQSKIAGILQLVEGIIEKRKKQHEDLDELVKARFVEMFGDPVENPMGWEKKKVKDCFDFISRGKQPEYVDHSDVIVLNQACIYWDCINWENIKYHNEKSSKKTLKLCDNDILITSTGTGTLGRCNIFHTSKNNKTYIIDSHVTVLRGNLLIKEEFFKWNLMDLGVQKSIYTKCVNGSTNQIELSKDKFSKFNIIVPPIELQNQFADFVKQTEEIKEKVQKSLDETQVLFDSLMQKYF